jgi:hypothetical protein
MSLPPRYPYAPQPERARRHPESSFISHAEDPLFISHGKSDAELAAALSELIKNVSGAAIKVVWSSDCLINDTPPLGGVLCYADLATISRVHLVIFLLTSRSIDDPWLFWEAGVCSGRHGRLVALAFRLSEKQARIGPFAREEICFVDKGRLQEWLNQILGFYRLKPQVAIEKAIVSFLEKEDRIHSSSAVTQLPPLRRHRMRSGQETE